jgi:hypothetical protein
VLFANFHLLGEKNGKRYGMMLNIVQKNVEDQNQKLKTKNS